MSIGQCINQSRRNASLTQKQLAEKIGMKHSVISKYERNQVSPDVITITKIAKALGISLKELLSPMFRDEDNESRYLE